MNRNTAIIIGIIILVVVVGGIYASTNKKDDIMMSDKIKDTASIESRNQEAIEKDIIGDQGDQTVIKKDETVMIKAGSYESYAPEKIALASSEHNVVLFFRASWCPTCRAVDADIKANLSKIPSNLTILDVNYDDSTSLKKKYGVTYQHTFVQVDAQGQLIKKWQGSPTLVALIAEVK